MVGMRKNLLELLVGREIEVYVWEGGRYRLAARGICEDTWHHNLLVDGILLRTFDVIKILNDPKCMECGAEIESGFLCDRCRTRALWGVRSVKPKRNWRRKEWRECPICGDRMYLHKATRKYLIFVCAFCDHAIKEKRE